MSLIHDTVFTKPTTVHYRTGETMLNLLSRTFTIPRGHFTYTIVEVTDAYRARPDLVAIELYDSDAYTDILCRLNGISNPFELQVGTYLVCPTIDTMSMFSTSENSRANDIVDETNDVPATSRANDANTTSRRANETLLNNKNFRIDKNHRVIIY